MRRLPEDPVLVVMLQLAGALVTENVVRTAVFVAVGYLIISLMHALLYRRFGPKL